MLDKINNMSYMKKLIIFSLALFSIKLIILPFVHEIDADAISRTFISLEFANNPHVIKSGNWPPIFFYIMGGALKIYNNQFLTPVIVNITLSIVLLFPLFCLMKRLFDKKIAFLLCVFFSFSPIIFRMSLLGMSEIPYLFFVILSVNWLAKGLLEKKIFFVLLSGIILSLASGIRYESWLIGWFITIIIFYYWSFKAAIVFIITASLIPCYWLISNYINTQNVLNSFNWALVAPNYDIIDSTETFLRRIWWYPLSLIFAFGPIGFFFVVKEIKFAIKNYKTEKLKINLIIVFTIFLIIWIVNCIRGSLLMQHRFSVTLFIFLLPFIGFYLQRRAKGLVKTTIILSATAFFLAFVYSSKGARPIPQLLTTDAETVSIIIKQNIKEKAGFICDFWNWETTYYLPFSTGLHQDNIKIILTDDSQEIISFKITSLVTQNNTGILLVNKANILSQLLKTNNNTFKYNEQTVKLQLVLIFENNSVACYKYNAIIIS